MRLSQRFAAFVIVSTLAGCASSAMNGSALPSGVTALNAHEALTLMRTAEQMRENMKNMFEVLWN